MKRRDFLLLRVEGSDRVAELSCEKLFMHFQNLSAGYQQGNEEAGTPDDAEWWAGEPSLTIESIDPDSFFSSVLEDLKEVNLLQVQDMEWLAQGEFRVRVDTLLTAFKAGGGKVLYKAPEELVQTI
ncbi:MAG: hypothetical protein OXU66_09825 [Gammaproteobacteria bacterium]|nr:hypothetical protein [Gammaproteobacteria bacterium]MDD9896320.1 hypothetical protein [Gammaproteobacteria bacterium]MDD9959227.1 hypothetical protein [Gammaproteobacteria bacterium]